MAVRSKEIKGASLPPPTIGEQPHKLAYDGRRLRRLDDATTHRYGNRTDNYSGCCFCCRRRKASTAHACTVLAACSSSWLDRYSQGWKNVGFSGEKVLKVSRRVYIGLHLYSPETVANNEKKRKSTQKQLDYSQKYPDRTLHTVKTAKKHCLFRLFVEQAVHLVFWSGTFTDIRKLLKLFIYFFIHQKW